VDACVCTSAAFDSIDESVGAAQNVTVRLVSIAGRTNSAAPPPGDRQLGPATHLGVRPTALAGPPDEVDRLAAATTATEGELIKLGRLQLLINDLCLPRNYAEAGGRIDGRLVAVPHWPLYGACCRHIYSPSRKARSRSSGRYLPGSAAAGVSWASARSLMARSACR
jgi:hypothetical protein